MKAKLFGLAMTIIGLVMMFFVGTSLESCQNRHSRMDAEKADSIWFQEMLHKTLPAYHAQQETYTDVGMILREQQIAQECISNDSIFTHLPKEVLSNVCVTLFRIKSQITLDDVVNEYRKYKNVYDNMDLHRAAEEVRKFQAMQEKLSQQKPPQSKPDSIVQYQAAQ